MQAPPHAFHLKRLQPRRLLEKPRPVRLVPSHRHREETTENGRRVITDFDYTNKIVLHPLRRVSGRPCTGMLPTVN